MTAVGLGDLLAVMAALGRDARRAGGRSSPGWPSPAGSPGRARVPDLVPVPWPAGVPRAARHVRYYGRPRLLFRLLPRVTGRQRRDREAAGPEPVRGERFFGWPLLVLVGLVVVGAPSGVVIALLVAGLVLAALSLGPEVKVNGRYRVPSVWGWVTTCRCCNSVGADAVGAGDTPIVGLLLAIGLDRALAFAAPRPSAGIAIRIVTAVVFTAALLPIVPTPLPGPSWTRCRRSSSRGVAGVHGRRAQHRVRAVGQLGTSEPLRWAAATRLDMRLAHGYFLGPNDTDGKAMFTAPRRPTTTLLSLLQPKNRRRCRRPCRLRRSRTCATGGRARWCWCRRMRPRAAGRR